MMMLISGFFYFINAVSIALRKNSKIFIFLFIGVLVLIASFPASTISDYFSYNYFYQNLVLQKGVFEGGYSFLSSTAVALGLSYSSFRLILFIIGFLILTIGISRYTKNLAVFFALYAIYPFMDDIVQVRNFLMMSCLIMASTYLFKDNKTNWVLYTFWILLGSSFHSSGYVYLLVIPIYYLYKYKYGKVILVSAVPILMLCSIIPTFRSVLSSVLTLLPFGGDFTAKLGGYLMNRANSAFLPLWVIIISMLILSIYNYRYFSNIQNEILDKNVYEEKRKMLFATICFMILSGFLATYLTVDLEFFRTSRNLYPILIASSVTIFQEKRNDKKGLPYISILVFLVLLSFLYFNIISARWHNIIIPALPGNTLFS